MAKTCVGEDLIVEGVGRIPLSKAVISGGFAFLSGQLGQDENGKLVGNTTSQQTEQTLKNIEAVLKQCGCTLTDVVKCQCYIAKKEDFVEFNQVYSKFFGSESPARTTIPTELLLGALVEIDVVAKLPE